MPAALVTMPLMTDVLVAHDGTDRGDDAVALARVLAPDARLVVLHVLTAPSLPWADRPLRSEAGAASAARLDALRAQLGDDHVVEAVEAPSVAHGLHDAAVSRDAAMIVLGGGTGGHRLSTIADRLLHGSPCSVVVDRGFRPTQLNRIAVAFNGTPEARAALQTAEAMAARSGAKLTLVCVDDIDFSGHPAARGYADVVEEQHHDAVRRMLDAAAALVQDEVTVEVVLRTTGPISTALAVAARELQADVLVCGSRGYGPARRVLLGSVGHDLLAHADCPVVAVPRPH